MSGIIGSILAALAVRLALKITGLEAPFKRWCETWRTDTVSGIGLGFVIVFGSMFAAIVYMKFKLGHWSF